LKSSIAKHQRENRMNKSLKRSTIVRSAALALVASAAAHAQVVDIDGGNSWSGWNSVGNSQTSGTWVKGSTSRTYDIYSTYFVLSAGQTVGGTRIANGAAGDGVGYTGETAGSLFSGAWQAGDRIVGMGVQYTGTTRGSTFFFHRDAGGNNIAAASSFGANDGVFSHDVGDSSSYMTTVAGNPRGQVRQYSVWNGFSQNGSPEEGNFNVPYGNMPTAAFPTRSFAVLDNGSMNRITSAQFFINIDAILRSNGGAAFGDADFGLSTRFGFWEGDQTTGWNGTQFSQQIFAIPAPGALALLGLAGVAGKRRRR
jgi:hypothetical protein